MIKITLLTVILLFAAFIQTTKAEKKQIEYENCYNVTRGMELLLHEHNPQKAEVLFANEIEEHKDNGYAYYWLSYISMNEKKMGEALEAVNESIKYLSKNKRWLSYAYMQRGRVYAALDEEEKAVADMSRAIKLAPDNFPHYESRGEFYFDRQQYDLAELDFRKITEIVPGEACGYMALGNIAYVKENYDEAIKMYSYAIKLDPDLHTAYSCRSKSYHAQDRFAEALDDAIMALDIERGDQDAFETFLDIAVKAYSLTLVKLKTKMKSNSEDCFWYYMLGRAYAQNRLFVKAIPIYQKALDLWNNDIFHNNLAICYQSLNDFTSAMWHINHAIEENPEYAVYLLSKIEIEESAGMVDEALRDIEAYLENNPDDADGYSTSSRLKYRFRNDIDGAIEDYLVVSLLEPDDPYCYLRLGWLYQKKGEEDLARENFEETLRIDSINSMNTFACIFSLFYLGKTEAAIEKSAMIQDDFEPNEMYLYYGNAATLYSLMGDLDKSMDYMAKALELGWNDFYTLTYDERLNNLRRHPDFEKLIATYKQKFNDSISEIGGNDVVEYEDKEAEIPFTMEGGICKVKCSVNSLPLYFVFDTGSSDVSISKVEASFMLKNDYLSMSDIKGKESFRTSTGELSEGTQVILKEVELCGLTLKNVKASVVNTQEAPLLLGQSVLSRLGIIEIDNDNKVIRVKYQERR